MTAASLHTGLHAAWSLNHPGGAGEHVVVVLPSLSLPPSMLSHYAERLVPLEHRYLLFALMLGRVDDCELVFVCSGRPDPSLVEHYLELTGAEQARHRLHIVSLDDPSIRPTSAKLLDRPDQIELIKSLIGARPAFLDPWNVTDLEVTVGTALGLPVYGTSPELRPLGFKSAGRHLCQRVGVPIPAGAADIHDVDEAVAVITRMREQDPALAGVVVKHDDSGAGDGNAVIPLLTPEGVPLSEQEIRAALRWLPGWFLADLSLGGVVEELIVGEAVTSPSAQIDITPTGAVEVLSTHEQLLGGPHGQVYLGCRFPADERYAAELARHARSIGAELARLGARGRVAIDFLVRPRGAEFEVLALEINLRKGGTTHPFAVLRNLAPGTYDEAYGRWVATDGRPRFYTATDNLLHAEWHGLPADRVLGAVEEAGLVFDRVTGTGVVLHMLSGLSIDGRVGVVAIGGTPQEADRLLAATEAAISSCLVPAAAG